MESIAVSALGYGAATLTTLSLFPQAVKTVRSGDTSAISLRMYGLFTLGILAWAVYGLLKADGPLIAANLITLVPATVVLERKLRALLDGRERWGRGPRGKG
ncbi:MULTISPECIES: SemiSWEET family sugar transporter [Synechococcales]|uniref:SemiSWEET family sugar transporter n=1 Tax=Synechococcales TaxID=1890424 RepID=UPI0020CE18F4|nr:MULTISPECIES: SemiSWEET transporter [Synechococcales]MCP9858594.1 SemiSWEET transporter [Cyanobium sp. Cruz-8H5]MCP9865749.1 SemiSWEET transporter [Cyanobium sp. Cruz-8D1]MEA5416238.1 SemiSWEET transporter [Synechococcus sp. BA-132 BA5]